MNESPIGISGGVCWLRLFQSGSAAYGTFAVYHLVYAQWVCGRTLSKVRGRQRAERAERFRRV